MSSLFKETLFSMYASLGNSGEQFQGHLRTMQKILTNILNNPAEPKFQKLRLSNENVKHVLSVPEARFLLEMCGFLEQALPTTQ
jgi:hypothetical protein